MRRPATLAALAVITLAAGCSSPQTEPPKIPTASSESSAFASEEEAVAAAEEAIDVYWTISNAVFKEGGKGVERLAPLSAKEWLEDVQTTAAKFREDAVHQVGDLTADSVQFLQSYGETLIVTACIDYSKHSIVNAEGEKLDLLDGPDRTLSQVKFEVVTKESEPSLLVAGMEPWQDSPC